MTGGTTERQVPRELISWLEELLDLPQRTGQPMVLGVSGPVAAGKSTLAQSLASWLSSARQATCAVLCIDDYEISRAKRQKTRTDGYDPSRYDLRRARADLIMLLNRTPASVTNCGRAFAEFQVTRTIEPSDVIVIEGIHALNRYFAPYLTGRIFINAEMPFIVGMRAIADLEQHGKSIEQAAEDLPEYYSYSRHAAHYANEADLVLQIEYHRAYHVEEIRQTKPCLRKQSSPSPRS